MPAPPPVNLKGCAGVVSARSFALIDSRKRLHRIFHSFQKSEVCVVSGLYFKSAVLIAIVFGLGCFQASAQTAQTTSSSAPASTLRGHVADPSGALIPGALVTAVTAKGEPAAKTKTDAAGGYVIRGLAPGSYVIQAEFSGFAPFVSAPIVLGAGQTKTVNIQMIIEAAQQQVKVESETPTVSTVAGANANAIVIKGKDLDALSDDPDELSNELQALAGPSAGPNGGQIYIDGFTGGQLPPKSAIREIRINRNPFSAEFDRLGYGRIEIITKPGTGQLHGRVFLMGNDDAFNTGSPFTKEIPSYYSIQGNGTVSGPLSKNASYFVSVEQRNTQDASIYTADTAIPSPGGYVPGVISGGLFAPQTRTEFSPRVDLALGQNNTLTLRWQFWRNHETGHIGNTALPSQDATSQNIENTFQLDDTQIISSRIVNETRFEYRRASNWQIADPSSAPLAPATSATAPTVSIPAYFTGGANSTQSDSGHSDHYELQDFVTMSAGRHALEFGTWMRDNRQATSTSSGFNGTFNFPSLAAYLDTLNGMANGQSVAQIQASCPAQQMAQGGCTPNKLTYVTGPYAFSGNLYDAAFFVQDDWTRSRLLTLSGGLRWETQNHIADHSDFAPRVAFAYALDGHKKEGTTKTVLRGGFGFFYDRFEIADLMNLEQYNGSAKSQRTTVISNPTCFDANSLQAALAQGCASSGASPVAPQIDAISPHYRSPYSEQTGLSLERQLTKTSTVSLTYLHSFGVHQMVVRNSNPFERVSPGSDFYSAAAGLPRLDPNLGIVDQYFPEAVYKQNQLILSLRGQVTHKLSVAGFYNWTEANSDGGDGSNPSNSYNLSQDYGRAAFVRPQFLFLIGTYNAPWDLTLSPFLAAQAGKPYDITTAQDLTGDNFFNNRPAYATPASNPANVAQTSYGALDTQPDSFNNLVAPNLGTGPAAVAFNLRVSRAFGFGPAAESGGGPPRGGYHGHHGFGGNPFSGGGGFHGPPGTGHKYSLTFSIQALNLFNDVNYGTPSGTVIPTPEGNGINGPGSRFGVSTKLASGLFSSPTSSASRRVYAQAFFTF